MRRYTIQCDQGGAEWHAARLGIPTASRFADIVTPTGKPTKNADRQKYICQLLAERLTGQMMTNFTTPAMQRGTELEPRARAWYQLETGREVAQVGLAVLEGDGWKCGASPDGLCVDRGLEIKCPLAHTMIAQLLDESAVAEYSMQIQAGMWVCGMERWDLVLFTDSSGIPNKVYEVKADPAMHAAFEEHIPAFCAELATDEARLIAMGGGGVRSSLSVGTDWPEGLK
jgi:hypothetical protein